MLLQAPDIHQVTTKSSSINISVNSVAIDRVVVSTYQQRDNHSHTALSAATGVTATTNQPGKQTWQKESRTRLQFPRVASCESVSTNDATRVNRERSD